MENQRPGNAICDEDAAGSCVHRWILAAPSGDSVEGTCRICGAKRAFTNRRRSNWVRRDGARG